MKRPVKIGNAIDSAIAGLKAENERRKKGDEMSKIEYDPIPKGEMGASQDVPFVKPPDDFEKNGLPYGAWCKCSECNRVSRSTHSFDSYPNFDGFLSCDACCSARGFDQVRERNGEGNVICPHCYSEEGIRVEMGQRNGCRAKLEKQDRFLGALAKVMAPSTRAGKVGDHWKCPTCGYEARE